MYSPRLRGLIWGRQARVCVTQRNPAVSDPTTEISREQVQSASDRPFTLRQTSSPDLSSGTSGLHVLKHLEDFWEYWRCDVI